MANVYDGAVSSLVSQKRLQALIEMGLPLPGNNTNKACWVLEASDCLLSRALVSQSPWDSLCMKYSVSSSEEGAICISLSLLLATQFVSDTLIQHHAMKTGGGMEVGG